MIQPIRNKLFTLIVLLALASGLFLYHQHRYDNPRELPPTEVTYEQPQDKANNTLPASLLIKVPFTPQAPTANWDELHNQACEEATAIMANAYFNNISDLPANFVEQEIDRLTAYQDTTFHEHLSIDTQQTAQMIEKVYNLHTELQPISKATIQQALAENKLVILPANGQLLHNPYFKTPGPIYHMLLITGYNDKGLITNDPGTKRGENYQYTYQTLGDSAGNWSASQNAVDLTDKQIIIVSK